MISTFYPFTDDQFQIPNPSLMVQGNEEPPTTMEWLAEF